MSAHTFAVLAGDCERSLSFEIEMLLPAKPETAVEFLRRTGNCDRGGRLGLVPGEHIVVEHSRLRRDGVVDVDERHGRRRRHFRLLGGTARLVAGFRHDEENDLSVETDLFGREHRIVVEALHSNVVLAGDVSRREHRDDARRLQHFRKIEIGDPAGSNIRQSRRTVQATGRLPYVIDIERRASDMLDRGVVRQRLADDPQPLLLARTVTQPHAPLARDIP
jgi:hypothetical protein